MTLKFDIQKPGVGEGHVLNRAFGSSSLDSVC